METMERTPGAAASVKAIIRASIHTFLKNYLCFNSVTILVLLPYSASILLLRTRTMPKWNSQGLEKMTATTSVLRVVFTLTFLVMAKSAIIRSLGKYPQDRIFPSFFQLYGRLLKTQMWNSVLAIAVSSVTFILSYVVHQSSFILVGFPSASSFLIALLWAAISYTITVNLSVINNISLVIAGYDNCSAVATIRKACKLRQREPGILVPAALSNLGYVGVESLFRYKVIGNHPSQGMPGSLAMIGETFLLSYMYSGVIVLDMVGCCFFLKRCSTEDHDEDEDGSDGYHDV